MQKLIVKLVVLFATASVISGHVTRMQQQPQEASTRFGALTVGEDKQLLFQGRPLKPSVDGNNSLDLGQVFRIGEADVVLVTDNGGTGCPFMYYLITVTESEAKATPAFGTCAELSHLKRTGGTLSVFMPGFRGPSGSNKARLKASRETHVFTFREGALLKDGEPVK